jgi:hypothetical protein
VHGHRRRGADEAGLGGLAAGGYYLRGDPVVHVSSTSVVVLRAPDGHVVYVANGRDGLLFRDVSGRWQRLGFPVLNDAGEVVFDPPTRMPVAPRTDPTNLMAALFA